MALAVNYFNLNIESFDRFTPVQFYTALRVYKDKRRDEYSFWQNEFRLNNYYTVVTQHGNKKLKKPSDLYKLFNEANIKDRPFDYNTFQKADLEFIKKVLSN